MKNLIIIVLLFNLVSCSTKKVLVNKVEKTNIVKVEEKNRIVRNGFRELKYFTINFEYKNGNKLNFTVGVQNTISANALNKAFYLAESIVKKDTTIISYNVSPGKYMQKFN